MKWLYSYGSQCWHGLRESIPNWWQSDMVLKGTIARQFSPLSLPGEANDKTALLINPPVYDVQYWAQWSQPYGLLRIVRLLQKMRYKRRELFDFMETTGEKRRVSKRRIAPGESFIEKNTPDPKAPRHRIEKDGQCLKL